jgi:hypothetical protein
MGRPFEFPFKVTTAFEQTRFKGKDANAISLLSYLQGLASADVNTAWISYSISTVRSMIKLAPRVCVKFIEPWSKLSAATRISRVFSEPRIIGVGALLCCSTSRGLADTRTVFIFKSTDYTRAEFLLKKIKLIQGWLRSVGSADKGELPPLTPGFT